MCICDKTHVNDFNILNQQLQWVVIMGKPMTKITRQKAHRKEERQRDLIIALEICKMIFLLEIVKSCHQLKSSVFEIVSIAESRRFQNLTRHQLIRIIGHLRANDLI